MAQSLASCENFLSGWKEIPSQQIEAAVFPSFVHLKNCVDRRVSSLSIGAQNCSTEEAGAFTGEISAQMLKEIGVKYCLVGHSERRQRGGETNETLALKLSQLEKVGIQAVFCIGETKEQRQKNQTQAILKDQIQPALDSKMDLILAYEPVWAIGTGLSASVEEIDECHRYIASLMSAPILYGGSVKIENASSILEISAVQGLLIGGASLRVETFSKICGFALESL